MKKIIILILCLLLVAAAFISFNYIIKPRLSKPLCTGYSFGPGQQASIEATFYALSLPEIKIDEKQKASIDCFTDKVFSYYNCSDLKACEICRTTNCTSQFLYTFVKIKNVIGFKEEDVIKEYNIDKIFQSRTGPFLKDPNYLRIGPAYMPNLTYFIDKVSSSIIVINKFNDILIRTNNTPITSYEEKTSGLKKLINYIPDQHPLDSSYFTLNIRGDMVYAIIKSSGFNNIDDLSTFPDLNITKLEYFCDLSRLEYPGDICSASNFVTVKEFCGEKLTEEENKIINDFLSQAYDNLLYRYCKTHFDDLYY
jgi:hypothetical protein